MLTAANAVLVVIDVQEKLARTIYEREKLIDNLQRLIKGAQVFEVPIIVTEQYPQGLGVTVPEIAPLLAGNSPLAKVHFSCCDDAKFPADLQALGRRQVLIAGIESHICVYQTATDLLKAGYEVYVVTDTVSSRTSENRQIGLNLMERAGAVMTSTETVLFEVLKVAKGDKFKAVSQIVK